MGPESCGENITMLEAPKGTSAQKVCYKDTLTLLHPLIKQHEPMTINTYKGD